MVKKGITPLMAKKIRASKGIEDTKLQKIRVDKGLSQLDLAEKSGVTKRAIQGYEQKSRPIEGARLEVLCDLCIALDCDIEDIVDSEKLIEKYTVVKTRKKDGE